MTKYTVAHDRRVREAKQETPAIWRGIGCLMIIFIPLMSYFIATLIVQAAVAQQWPLPYQLMGYPVLPQGLLKVSALSPLWTFIQSQANLYAILLFTVILIVAVGALVSFIYAIAWRYVGPPRYGPLDAPPPKITTKRYKR